MSKKELHSYMLRMHVMNSIEGLAWSFIGLFIPIYFLDLGYSLQSVFLYYIVQNTAILVAAFLVFFLGRKVGLQKILMIRFPILFVFLLLLINLKSGSDLFYLMAILDGMQVAFYWMPLHIIFAKFVHKEDVDGEMGRFLAIPKVVKMFGPILGALMIWLFDFRGLFIFACCLFAIDFIPFLRTETIAIDYKFRWKDGKKFYKKYKKYFFSEVFNNIGEEVEGVIWPLFIYLSLINIASVGVVGSLLALSSAFFAYITGNMVNKQNRRQVIMISSIFIMAIWFMKYFLAGEWYYYTLTIFSGFAYVAFSVPYYSLIYSRAKRENEAVFFAFREIPVWIARIIVFILAIIFVDRLEVLFLIAGIVYIYFLFWKSEKTPFYLNLLRMVKGK